MTGMQNLPALHAPPEVGLAESKCSFGLCQPRAAFHTRMPGTQNLSALHTTPATLLPVSTCSHRACVPGNACFSRFPFPSKGVWGPAPMSAYSPCPSALKCREREICQFRTRRRKSVWQKVNALPACANRAPLFIPECREREICQFRTRRWKSVWQKANALPACANRAPLFIPECREHRICQLCTRRRQSFCQSAHARTERACRARLAFRAFPFPVKGVWGPAPMSAHSPCPATVLY